MSRFSPPFANLLCHFDHRGRSITAMYCCTVFLGLALLSSALGQSDEQLQKAKPLYEAGAAAEDNGNYLEAAEHYQKVWDILDDESTTALRFLLVNVARRSVDWDAIDRGGVPSDRVILMLKKCPSPAVQYDNSDEDFGQEQMQYGLIQLALCQHANSLRQYDSAEIYLSRAEAYINSGSGKAEEYAREAAGDLDNLRRTMDSARSNITRNRGTDNFYRTLGAVKTFLGNNSGGAAGTIRCPHCSKGDVYFDRKNALGHWVTDSKPCTQCHGTGWVTAVRP